MHLEWAGRAGRDEGCELLRVTCRAEAGALMPAHDHDFPELFWVEDGVCSHLVGGSRVDLPAGSLVFVRAQDRHQLRADISAFTICNVTLHPRWAADLAARHGASWRWAWPVSGPGRVVALDETGLVQVRSWFDDLWRQPRGRLAVEGFLLDMLRLVVPRAEAPRDGAPAWLRQALSALRDPEVSAAGLSELLRRAKVSREHFARACRRHRQRSPGDLVAEARLDHACRLLRHTDDGIVGIAEACGFGSPAQFYRRFAGKFGCPPAAWRRSGR